MLSLLDDGGAAAALARHGRASRRVRLEIGSLIDNPALARDIEASAGGRPGITRVVADPRSGRVLVEYEPGVLLDRELDQLRRSAGRRRSARTGPAPAWQSAWHADEAAVVIARLETSAGDGLTAGEARRRLAAVGANELLDEEPASRFAVLARQLANLPTALLGGSTVVSALLGDVVEAGAILTVIGLNAVIGYRVERRSDDLLAAWRTAEVGTALVIRDGELRTVSCAELVPGDLLVVRAGEVVGADARVVESHRLAADEAALTGESEPVAKSAAPVAAAAALAERTSMLYRGTAIASGHGRAIVVATGAATEIAQVQQLAEASRAPKGRLQRRLGELSSRLAWSGLSAAALSALASVAWRRPPIDVLRESVALGVAAIPEGLPVAATAALVRAMARMRARGIVVRRLAIAEALGGVTVACVDKTGTLTENRMRLETVSVQDGGRPRRIAANELCAPAGTPLYGPLAALLIAGVLNSDVEYQSSGNGHLQLAGSSTERALIEAAQRAGIDPCALRRMWPRRRLVERSSDAAYVITEHSPGVGFIKGAPEQVVPLCELDPAAARAILDDNAALAGDGLRVLAVAWRRTGETGAAGGAGAGAARRWRYLGLVGLRDPLRAGSADAIRAAASAGIRTVMLTGDQRATAEAIARQARLDGEVIEGRELARVLAAPDAAHRLGRIAVIARVAPADKVAVVDALRRHGEVVAMAGDGINDAPALRAADVGIAVGARSSDVARQTADVVLERADLRSILAAVAEGRAVQDNLRRSIRFQAAGNLGEVLLVLGASLAGRRLIPSLGLLWINLLTDTLPGLALALESSDDGLDALLARPPIRPGAPILDAADWRRVGRDGAVIAAASAVAAIAGGPLAAFGTIGATQFGYAAACRAPDQPIRPRFAAMIGGSAALHLLAVASAPARALLRIGGRTPLAIASSGLGIAVPLYLAWRRHADREITRRGSAADHPSKETSP
jgi:P-type Ca2+ transporter type 2C